MIGGGNVATILLMLIAGYADLLPPQRFPLLACMGLAFPGFLIVNMAFLVFWLMPVCCPRSSSEATPYSS